MSNQQTALTINEHLSRVDRLNRITANVAVCVIAAVVLISALCASITIR